MSRDQQRDRRSSRRQEKKPGERGQEGEQRRGHLPQWSTLEEGCGVVVRRLPLTLRSTKVRGRDGSNGGLRGHYPSVHFCF